MRVLVTGGLGFLGRAVTGELVGHGHDAMILSHTASDRRFGDVPVVRADLRDPVALHEAIGPLEVEGACHLAALTSGRDSRVDPLGYFDTNLMGTVNLIRALGSGVRFVMTSTSVVYGSGRPGRLAEDVVAQPEDPYGASKLAAEQILCAVAGTGEIGATILRCFNIAGAIDGYTDPSKTRIVPNALRVAAGQSPFVGVNGDGSTVREFTHVVDVAVAVRLALEASEIGRHQIFNVGTGQGVTMMDLIETVRSVTGAPIAVVHKPAVPEAHTLVADPGRIHASLGWRPRRSSIGEIVADAWSAWDRR